MKNPSLYAGKKAKVITNIHPTLVKGQIIKITYCSTLSEKSDNWRIYCRELTNGEITDFIYLKHIKILEEQQLELEF